MKIVAIILLVIGLLLFLTSFASFVYHFATTGNPTVADVVIMVTSGCLAIFASFMRGRAIAKIPIFEVTAEDRAQLGETSRQIRHAFGIRQLLGFIGGLGALLGALLCVGGMTYWFTSPDLGWKDSVLSFAVGALLVFLSWLLVRDAKR